MKSLFFIISAFIFLTSFLVSQIVVDNAAPYNSSVYLINDVLLSSDIQASNHNFEGDPVQLGYFDGSNSNLGLESGVVLATGNIEALESFIIDGDEISVDPALDPDLLGIANSVPPLIGQNFSLTEIFDMAILEFEFIPTSDSVSFNYVFGTEEYFGYENTEFNDVFGFFISGPGITGPYASPPAYPNGSINIANFVSEEANSLNSVLPITVSSLNMLYNSQFFVDNQNHETIEDINGFTVPMTATAQVQCGETYHIRLAIADGSDQILSSYVFLEESSFSSFNDGLITNNTGQDSSHLIVDCGSDVILSATIDQAFNVLWSTGDSSTSITVQEGGYWYLAYNESCQFLSDTVFVEWPSIEVSPQDTSICVTDNIIITPIHQGQAPFTYLWNTGQTTSEILVGPGQYSVSITDANACHNTTNIDVGTIESPTAILSGDGQFCEGHPFINVPLTIDFTGQPPFNFSYTDGINSYNGQSIDLQHIIYATQIGQFQLTSLNDAFCTGLFSGLSLVLEVPLPTTTLSGGGVICPGDSSEITLEVETEFMPLQPILKQWAL